MIVLRQGDDGTLLPETGRSVPGRRSSPNIKIFSALHPSLSLQCKAFGSAEVSWQAHRNALTTGYCVFAGLLAKTTQFRLTT